MIPAKSSNYDLPDSYDNIEQTLITADQILSDAVENAKLFFIHRQSPLLRIQK